ncbi:MAG: divergent polysaccharide deacetylase family protein [Candidatus Oleimicrobiaceae bacterium]
MQRRRAHKQRAARWRRRKHLLLLGTMVLVLLLVYGKQRHRSGQPRPAKPTAETVRSALRQVALRHGVNEQEVREEDGWLVISLPADKSLAAVSAEMRHRAQELGAGLAEQASGNGWSRLVLRMGDRGLLGIKLVHAQPAEHGGPLIALVIDDFGYSTGELAKAFLELPWAVTVSIIPGLPFSGAIAEQAAAAGKEVMVHMPMEALHEPVEDRGYTLLVTLSEKEIRDRVARAIACVPGAAGMNNHQGSRATADVQVMSVLMDELKTRGLYFVDSRTNSQSRALAMASRMRVPCVANDMFLDVEPDTAKIYRQLSLLARVAKRKGKAVGIGHVRRSTYELLRREVPRLQEQGFRFVPVSKVLGLPAPPLAFCGHQEETQT